MTTVLVIIGVIFLVIAAGLIYVSHGMQRKLSAMHAVATSSAGSVSSMRPGEAVEVTGTLRCDTPLTAELSGQPCAYFSTKLTREYEEQDRDSRGRTRSNRRSETVASSSDQTAFVVEDDSGTVWVDPQGADVDALEVVNRFEQQPGDLVIGGVPINLTFGGFSNRRTLGYRYTEHILPENAPVYVLGVVQEDRTIGCAPSGVKDKPFIVSFRSEDALRAHWTSSARWLRIGGLACAAVGIALLVAASMVR